MKEKEIIRTLYSKAWKERIDDTDVIVIEKDFLDGEGINKISDLYKFNKNVLDKYFPKLIRIERAKRRFFFEFVEGRQFGSFFSIRRILRHQEIYDLSYTIGKKLANFHKENIEIRCKDNLLSEFENRLDLIRDEYPKLYEQAIEIPQEIESLEDRMICIYHDVVPWNILVTEDSRIWFIDYFDARLGLRYEDVWKFIFAVKLLEFHGYPSQILKKSIDFFLEGYHAEAKADVYQSELAKVIYELFYLTYLSGRPGVVNILKRRALAKLLEKDIRSFGYRKTRKGVNNVISYPQIYS